MTEQTSGGMFSRLLNPETAKPKPEIKPPKAGGSTSVPAVEKKPRQQDTSTAPTPLLRQKKEHKVSEKKEKKRKVGAYFTKAERQILDDVEYNLNRGERIIGQSEILALGVETLGRMLDGKRFASIEKIREYIDSFLLKGHEK
jgi:hypothetical protein